MRETSFNSGVILDGEIIPHADGGTDILKMYYNESVTVAKMSAMERAISLAYVKALKSDAPEEKLIPLLKAFLKVQEKYPNINVDNF